MLFSGCPQNTKSNTILRMLAGDHFGFLTQDQCVQCVYTHMYTNACSHVCNLYREMLIVHGYKLRTCWSFALCIRECSQCSRSLFRPASLFSRSVFSRSVSPPFSRASCSRAPCSHLPVSALRLSRLHSLAPPSLPSPPSPSLRHSSLFSRSALLPPPLT